MFKDSNTYVSMYCNPQCSNKSQQIFEKKGATKKKILCILKGFGVKHILTDTVHIQERHWKDNNGQVDVGHRNNRNEIWLQTDNNKFLELSDFITQKCF